MIKESLCTSCRGVGMFTETCPKCRGRYGHNCSRCANEGSVLEPCKACKGTGEITEKCMAERVGGIGVKSISANPCAEPA